MDAPPTAQAIAVTSELDGAGGDQPFLAVWRDSSTLDLECQLVSAFAPVGSALTIDSGSCRDGDADSDGSSFVVSHVRDSPRQQVVATTLNLGPFMTGVPSVIVSESVILASSTEALGTTGLTSQRSAGGLPPGFLAVWHALAGGTGDVAGAIYDSPGPGNRYCIGAPNSFGAGARIHAAGSISISLETFELRVESCPPGASGMFFVGLAQTQVPFGDGFRCVGTPFDRITPPLAIEGDGSASLVLDFDLPYGEIIEAGSPGVNYQFWYRDPSGGPAHFNLSDAINVQHTP